MPPRWSPAVTVSQESPRRLSWATDERAARMGELGSEVKRAVSSSDGAAASLRKPPDACISSGARGRAEIERDPMRGCNDCADMCAVVPRYVRVRLAVRVGPSRAELPHAGDTGPVEVALGFAERGPTETGVNACPYFYLDRYYSSFTANSTVGVDESTVSASAADRSCAECGGHANREEESGGQPAEPDGRESREESRLRLRSRSAGEEPRRLVTLANQETTTRDEIEGECLLAAGKRPTGESRDAEDAFELRSAREAAGGRLTCAL